jgi:RNA polymerase sigma-70 factor (ECF subfamily)
VHLIRGGIRVIVLESAAGSGGPTRVSGNRPATAPPASMVAVESTGFDAFYAANFDRLIMQLYAYTGDLAQAQDVVQEAFARALPRWEQVSGYDDPAAWVRRVAWNLATSRWRQLRTFRAYASRHRPEHVTGPTPDRVALATALATLPASLRRAVVLHYVADLSVADIARQEGVPDGTVKSWLHRGRAALAVALAETRAEVRDV